MDVAAEGAVVFVALQGLKQLDDLGHLVGGQGGTAEAVVGQLGQVGLGGGQLGKGLPTDMEDIPGVEAGGDGAVEGVLPDEVQGAPLEGIDLVVDEDVSRAGQGEQELVVVVEMEAAHVPGHIVIQL